MIGLRRNLRERSASRGFVIVAVLWILLALSSLVLIFSAYLSASARALANNDMTLQTEALVSAGLELAAYQLAISDDKTRPSHGAFQFRLDDADVAVNFTSEAARIDLNYASKATLSGLFVVLGARKDAASEYADRIIGWRTRPTPGSDNAEAARYNALGYAPRQALFTHVNELALVAGLPSALVDRALPFVTVFNGSADVDPAIAASEIRVATGESQDKRDGFDDHMSLQGSLATQASPPQGAAPPPQSTCYRIAITIRFRNSRRTTSEAVIALGDKVEPYRVLSWQDDVELRTPVSLRGSR